MHLIEFYYVTFPVPHLVCKTNKMGDLPLPQIREKKFRQQEINLDQFTDEELCSKNRFGRESIQYLVEILKNAGPREKDEEKT